MEEYGNEIDLGEKEIAERMLKTAQTGELDGLDFPKEVKGLTIVNIGAGLSTGVLELQKRGANAIAVDYAYTDLDELEKTIGLSAIIKGLAILPELTEKGEFKAGPIKLTGKAFADEMRDAFIAQKEFREAQEGGTIKAVAALAGRLPFPDNSVDVCFSVNCITELAGRNRGVFIGAVVEALRVLKPGGNLQLLIWNSELDSPVEKQDKKALLTYLKENKIPFRVERTDPSGEIDKDIPPILRLKVIKPADKKPSPILSLIGRFRHKKN